MEAAGFFEYMQLKSWTSTHILTVSKSKLSADRKLSYINRLEHSVVRGDVKNQQASNHTGSWLPFWKDSVENAFLPSVYYLAEAAKLENSEKSLTFAAQLFLNNLRAQDNPACSRNWMASERAGTFLKGHY